jgi:hypothetical protein
MADKRKVSGGIDPNKGNWLQKFDIVRLVWFCRIDPCPHLNHKHLHPVPDCLQVASLSVY